MSDLSVCVCVCVWLWKIHLIYYHSRFVWNCSWNWSFQCNRSQRKIETLYCGLSTLFSLCDEVYWLLTIQFHYIWAIMLWMCPFLYLNQLFSNSKQAKRHSLIIIRFDSTHFVQHFLFFRPHCAQLFPSDGIVVWYFRRYHFARN